MEINQIFRDKIILNLICSKKHPFQGINFKIILTDLDNLEIGNI
jgi:hypothetical protein